MCRRILAQKVLRQDQDILAALAQGRDLKDHHRQAMVEVRSETSLRDTLAQIRRCRGNDFDVELVTPHCPQTSHTFLIKGAEEFSLEQQWQRVNLVQEQRAVRGAFHKAGLGTFGISERARLKAEQFHLQQRFRDGRAVDIDKRPLGARTTVVDDPCDQPLACARFPLQQQRWDKGTPNGVEGSEMANLRPQRVNSGSIAHNAVRGMATQYRA
jgi:hypothetical protein